MPVVPTSSEDCRSSTMATQMQVAKKPHQCQSSSGAKLTNSSVQEFKCNEQGD